MVATLKKQKHYGNGLTVTSDYDRKLGYSHRVYMNTVGIGKPN